MRIKLNVVPKGRPILLEKYYKSTLMGFVYSLLPKDIGTFVHNVKFSTQEGRPYGMFSFSQPLTKGRVEETNSGEKIAFDDGFSFIISSPFIELIEYIFNEVALSNRTFRISDTPVIIREIDVLKTPCFPDKAVIQMISPVTIHSTFIDQITGKKFVYYYSPLKEGFNHQIDSNIRRKYSILYGDPGNRHISITPIAVKPKYNRKIEIFRGLAIEGWTGIYRIEGDPELIRVAYEWGLGARNSMGFGMWKVYP